MFETGKIPQYLDEIEHVGYVEIQDAFPKSQLLKINEVIARPFDNPTVNGKYGYVQFGSTRFLTTTFRWGKEIIDLYTDRAVVDLADQYVGQCVHLSNHRIYRSFPSGEKMAWHVDNKIDTFDTATQRFVTNMESQTKGCILILYLSDVVEGGLQIVAGSHAWSHKANKETWDEDQIGFKEKIVTFNNRPMGTGIFYDSRAIHRAQPYRSGPARTSLFAQYSSSTMPVGEPVIINSRDIPGLSELQQRVLNFGREPSTENWPIGSPAELFGFGDWLRLGAQIVTQKSRRILERRG